MKKLIIPIIIIIALFSCTKKEEVETNPNEKIQNEVQTYLDKYNTDFQKLLAASAEAEWQANTKIMPNDTITEKLVTETGEAFTNFTGSNENIEAAKKYLQSKDKLTDLQVRQLDVILYMAGANPASAKEVVAEKIKAELKQTQNLYGYSFTIDGKEVTTNKIDDILFTSKDLAERLKAWESSKQVGVGLKDGLENLQSLRNKTVQSLGFDNYIAYQASEYGYSTDELRKVCNDMIKDLWPLYRELHTWARYTMAEKYNKEVPDLIPAHWLPNRWGQEWNKLVNVEGVDLDKSLGEKSAEWIVTKGEEFYVSMGFDPLPKSFYEKSSLYPLPEGADYKKNNHASAWHMNNAEDVRSLMSVEPNTKWWGTTLHELGHIYYYMEYSNPDVPIILRGGANRAYHEGIGTMIGLASMQLPFLEEVGLVEKGTEVDEIQMLLSEALDYVVVVPWGAGVMTEFEYELYANNLPKDQFNAKWWELKKKYQGIIPPNERPDESCDACSKTHINNDAAQYYDYAMSTILLFQFHDYIAKNILKQDPHATNYWGNKEVGKFLHNLLSPGASVDWKEHLQASIGSDMSAKPMVDYFAPLYDWLKKENEGRTYALPETFE